jgi:hypothetical protein
MFLYLKFSSLVNLKMTKAIWIVQFYNCINSDNGKEATVNRALDGSMYPG